MTIRPSDFHRDTGILAMCMDDGTPVPVRLTPPACEPVAATTEEPRFAILPMFLLGLGILLTISWNALLLWQFVRGVMFLIGYVFA